VFISLCVWLFKSKFLLFFVVLLIIKFVLYVFKKIRNDIKN
jgi:hypothetical protein